MANRRNKSEPEYDSDDMSAGARLMRYYVSDEPQPDTFGEVNSIIPGTEPQRPENILSGEQHVTNKPRVPRSTGKVVLVAESAFKAASRGKKKTKDDDDDDDYDDDDDDNGDEDEDDDDSDNAVFRGDLADFKGDVLFDIVGRYSHQEILEKVATSHPQANFGQKQLTWRIANAIVTRSNRQGVTKLTVRAELDAMRIANGVEFPRNYRPKSQGQQGGCDRKDEEDDAS